MDISLVCRRPMRIVLCVCGRCGCTFKPLDGRHVPVRCPECGSPHWPTAEGRVLRPEQVAL